MHSTLFICTALIINVLQSVDNFVFYLHAVYTLSTLVCTLILSLHFCHGSMTQCPWEGD